MKPSRRNLLALGGGAMAGVVFTPLPWKLLDDTAIWTQNWPWIPQPARGPVEVKAAACSLCPHGCGLQVRMAAGFPVGVSGAPAHPVSGGALCPLAFGAHQLNWHPRRLHEVRRRGRAASWDAASMALRAAAAEGPVAVIDGRPGRGASAILRDFAGKSGAYVTAPGPEERSLAPYAAWSGVPASALGYDLESARTIISFGAPLLDGWGTPGRFTRLWSTHAAGLGDPELRLIQIEPGLSHTATLAWRWVPARPGSDAALAAGLARVLVEERLVPAKGPVPATSVADAAGAAGLPADAIVELARMIAQRAPALAISVDGEPAVAALNLLLGGGIVQRREIAAPQAAAIAPRAVVIDATVPWEYEPASGAEVFRFAAWDGGGSKADWLLPAPGFLEEITEHPSAPGSAVASYALSPALMDAPADVRGAAAFVGGTPADAVLARCQEIFRARNGGLYRRGAKDAVPLASLESAARLQDELLAGAVWVDDPAGSRKVRCELKEWPAAAAGTHRGGWADAWSAPVLPPLATKLYQESNLREVPARSRI